MRQDRDFHTVRGYQMLNSENQLLTSSMEDYLEMIYRTCQEDQYARVNQLAERLNVQPSSATRILKKLKELGLVNYQRYGIIQLTEEGREMGAFLLKRHQIIDEFLKNLGVEETRLKDTEMIEHDVSYSSLKSCYAFNSFLKSNPDVLRRFRVFRENIEPIDLYKT